MFPILAFKLFTLLPIFIFPFSSMDFIISKLALAALSGSSSWLKGVPNIAINPSPKNLLILPPYLSIKPYFTGVISLPFCHCKQVPNGSAGIYPSSVIATNRSAAISSKTNVTLFPYVIPVFLSPLLMKKLNYLFILSSPFGGRGLG